MIEALAWNSELARFKTRSLHTSYSMGPPLPDEVLQGFEKKTGTKVIEGYGLTEASPLTHANPFGGIRKPGSIGIPLPDTDAMIVDPAGEEKEMPPGETGELIIRGPQVMKGYWNRVEETEKTLRGGWLHTGDLGRMDEDGFFYVTGKVKI
jgi:long-chain acyl-CoA synthetase